MHADVDVVDGLHFIDEFDEGQQFLGVGEEEEDFGV